MSERRRESVVPAVFWYFSLAGGSRLSAYALFRDPVILASAAPRGSRRAAIAGHGIESCPRRL
jgi:lipid-A-disaccharide synthase-like uncharacterized protein